MAQFITTQGSSAKFSSPEKEEEIIVSPRPDSLTGFGNNNECAHVKKVERCRPVDKDYTTSTSLPTVLEDAVVFDALRQGVMQLHIGKLVLSHDLLCVLKEASPAVFLSWTFYGKDRSTTPVIRGPDAEFDCYYGYNVDVSCTFLSYLSKVRIWLYLLLADWLTVSFSA